MSNDSEAAPTRHVALSGDLDYARREELGALAAALTADPADVDIDLGAVTFLGTEGIQLLALLEVELARTGHRLTVHRAPRQVWRALEVCGLAHLLQAGP